LQHSKLDVLDDCMNDELLFRAATSQTTPGEEAEVAEWTSASADNEQRLQDMVEILRLAADADDELAFGPAPTAEEMLARRGVRNGGRRPGLRHGGRWRAWLVPATVAAGLAIALPLALHDGGSDPAATATAPFGSDEFVTEAEPATVGLRDGSVVRLAPASRLRVHTRPNGREVSLTGRGYFAIAPDPEAPFTVSSDAGTVTVLGTRFDMTVAGGDLRVIVVEGSVRLSARGSQVVVGAGQLAQVLGGNLVPPVDVPDPASLMGWIGNFIAFHDTPLRTVAREIEQRFQVRVELSDDALGDRTVTALFAGRSYEEIAEVICVVAHLRCTRVGDVLNMAPAR
jgi:ferric-dicitrate binding protein FerR (iron transport regulator)